MDNELYDYRKYDQVWKRVNPQENPYPEARSSAAAPRTGHTRRACPADVSNTAAGGAAAHAGSPAGAGKRSCIMRRPVIQ